MAAKTITHTPTITVELKKAIASIVLMMLTVDMDTSVCIHQVEMHLIIIHYTLPTLIAMAWGPNRKFMMNM